MRPRLPRHPHGNAALVLESQVDEVPGSVPQFPLLTARPGLEVRSLLRLFTTDTRVHVVLVRAGDPLRIRGEDPDDEGRRLARLRVLGRDDKRHNPVDPSAEDLPRRIVREQSVDKEDGKVRPLGWPRGDWVDLPGSRQPGLQARLSDAQRESRPGVDVRLDPGLRPRRPCHGQTADRGDPKEKQHRPVTKHHHMSSSCPGFQPQPTETVQDIPHFTPDVVHRKARSDGP